MRVDPDVLYVADDRVLTSAGTAAGIDLCLHIVSLDHGVDVAATVARRLVMPLFRQAARRSTSTSRSPHAGHRASATLLDWARANLDAGYRWTTLAHHGAMSTRTLTRPLPRDVGMSPAEWLRRERLRLAQRLLETTGDPIEIVARRAGYESPTTMRAQFADRLHTSPRAYRRTFRR